MRPYVVNLEQQQYHHQQQDIDVRGLNKNPPPYKTRSIMRMWRNMDFLERLVVIVVLCIVGGAAVYYPMQGSFEGNHNGSEPDPYDAPDFASFKEREDLLRHHGAGNGDFGAAFEEKRNYDDGREKQLEGDVSLLKEENKKLKDLIFKYRSLVKDNQLVDPVAADEREDQLDLLSNKENGQLDRQKRKELMDRIQQNRAQRVNEKLHQKNNNHENHNNNNNNNNNNNPPQGQIKDPDHMFAQKQQQIQHQEQQNQNHQHHEEGGESRDYRPKNDKQKAIVESYKWAWAAYKKHAWGHDELLPISNSYSEWFRLGLTLIDGLDTMYIMGLKDEFNEAKQWVEHSMNIDQDVDVNLFETTIRVLGGLLSTYHLSGDQIFKEKAHDLGERLLHAFNERSGVPYSDVNLKTHRAHQPQWGPDSSTSEVSTVQLEFKELSRITGDAKYDKAVTKVMEHLDSLPKRDGLVPIFINANSGQFSGNTITLGARGDSYYEYLLKQWIQTSKSEEIYRKMYTESVNGIMKHLIKRSIPHGLVYVAELLGDHSSPKMDHLVCFLPGLLALGSINGFPHEHLVLAKEITQTCYEMYARMPTGLAGEITHFHTHGTATDDLYVKDADAHNLLRPETVESLFIMYRITKDPLYREMGWNIYQAFEKYTKLATGGYSSIHSVKNIPVSYRDKMESFFLGETLKYLYLLFEDDFGVIPLDKYVFNTEAHPLPIFRK